ncbi:MAG TPA: response regulator [Thermoanaerobaculia bacterium]
MIHEDDAFRRTLITALDRHGFTVTYAAPDEAMSLLTTARKFRVIILGLDLKSERGVNMLEQLRTHRDVASCGVMILGDPDPAVRTIAPWADETLMKPVDVDYLAKRARSYCSC